MSVLLTDYQALRRVGVFGYMAPEVVPPDVHASAHHGAISPQVHGARGLSLRAVRRACGHLRLRFGAASAAVRGAPTLDVGQFSLKPAPMDLGHLPDLVRADDVSPVSLASGRRATDCATARVHARAPAAAPARRRARRQAARRGKAARRASRCILMRWTKPPIAPAGVCNGQLGRRFPSWTRHTGEGT